MSEQFQMTRRSMLAGAAIAGAVTPLIGAVSAHAEEAVAKTAHINVASLPRVKVDLVKPPFVHAHTQKAEGGPKVVEFTLTIEEKKIVIDEQGTELHAMTFNGSVPGPLMVVHQDDYVELTLINPDTNTLQHNIDFHSATGALGGRRTDGRQSGRHHGAALQGEQGGRLRLPLRTSRLGSVARHFGDERRDHGAAARGTDRRQRQFNYL